MVRGRVRRIVRAIVRGVAAVAALSLLPSAPAHAQVIAGVERALLPLASDVLADIPESFWQGLTFVRTEEDRQRALRADHAGQSLSAAGERSARETARR